MSKYAPLKAYLEQSTSVEVFLKFEEIEHIIGCPLPASSKKYPAWWSNDSSTHVQADAWRNAGYKTAQIDLGRENLVFIRDKTVKQSKPASEKETKPLSNPIFGCMKGTVTIPQGVDLTQPAMPEWSEIAQNAGLPE